MIADTSAALAAVLLAVQGIGNDTLRPAAILAAPLVVLVSKVIGLYDGDDLRLRKSTLDEFPQLFQLAAMYTLLLSLLQSHLIDGSLGTLQIVGVWAMLSLAAALGRALARSVAGALTPPERCLVIGDTTATRIVEQKLNRDGGTRHAMAGCIAVDLDGDRRQVSDRIRRAIDEHDVDRVILVPQAADSCTMLDAIRLVKSMGVKVSLLPRLFEVVGTSVVFDELDGITVLGVRRFGLTRSSALVKRAMDVVVAATCLAAVVPAVALIAIAIRLDSPGPLLVRQERVGRNGKRFGMLQFRSMVTEAHDARDGLTAESGQRGMAKSADDPRVTRVGRVLRSTSLDEVPQFLNVLVGDMSVVGPRPLAIDEDALIEGGAKRRLHLVPGMTGPWQVLGSTRMPLQEMAKIDYLYIANWSLWGDVKILLRTVAHVLHRDGF